MIEFALRVAVMYFLALFMIRILGKSALGELGPFDIVVMTGVGETVISVAMSKDMPIYEGIIILATLTILELIMGYVGLKSGTLSNLINGKPVVLIEDGQILKKNLGKEKFNIDDLMQELRKQGIRDIRDVKRGILGSCGGFSAVLKKEKEAVTREDLGIATPDKNDEILQTIDQLPRAEIFARLNKLAADSANEPKESAAPNLNDRITNIEEQLERILTLMEKRDTTLNS